jgi:hypothetical protein
VSVSEPDQPTPAPGDADITEVRTPDESPSPLETPAEQPKPVEQPAGTPDEGRAQAPFSTPAAAFSSPTPPPDPPQGAMSSDATSPADKAAQVAADRPEVLVGTAFAGGLVLALLLRRLGD